MPPYCTSTDIEQAFGPTNVSGTGGWADLDNDGDAGKITARITYMIAEADAEIDAHLRTVAFATPPIDRTGATPTLINRLSAKKAGLLLFAARGAEEFDPRSGEGVHRFWHIQQWVDNTLTKILEKGLDIGAVQGAQR
jgi:hypothetical protein